MKTYNEMVDLFERANRTFLQKDIDLFYSGVSERTLCGALMLHLHDLIALDSSFDGYYTDVEYNRNRGGKLKTIKKTVVGPEMDIVTINCDLILHSRGLHSEQDNLIAIEMKKSNRPQDSKEKDRERLKALTKESYDDIWSYDGKSLPEHVCRYVLGVYYEINYAHRKIMLEYYQKGKLGLKYSVSY